MSLRRPRVTGLTSSERRTYDSLRARGFSHNVAMNDALDGVTVETLRADSIRSTPAPTPTTDEDDPT